MRAIFLWACVATVVAVGGCNTARKFLPRTHTTAASPDGRFTAFVRQELNMDPPDDHLFLATRDGKTERLLDLGGDVDWCKAIVWAPNSRRVGFVIDDQRLAIFDAEMATLSAMLVLVGNGTYGGTQEARNVAFNADGTAVSFERFDRPVALLKTRDGGTTEYPVTSEGSPAPETIRTPARSHGRETVKIPTVRLQLRLTLDPPSQANMYVVLTARDQRQVTLAAKPSAHGLVRLPAFDDGPLDSVLVFQQGHRQDGTTIRDVVISNTPVPVTLKSIGAN